MSLAMGVFGFVTLASIYVASVLQFSGAAAATEIVNWMLGFGILGFAAGVLLGALFG